LKHHPNAFLVVRLHTAVIKAETREKHGWFTVNGAGSVITNP
jgi:hypothetical protein